LGYDPNGVTTLEGNYDGKGKIGIQNYTWSNFNSTAFTRKGRYVCSLSQPTEATYAALTKGSTSPTPTPLPKPTNVWIKASCGAQATTADSVVLSWGATNATSFWLHVYKDGKDYINNSMGGSTSLTRTFPAGGYTAFIEASNSAGAASPVQVDFVVKELHTTHTWDAGKVTREPTIGLEGEKRYTCQICGATKTEILPKLPGFSGSLEDGEITYEMTNGLTDTATITVTQEGVMYIRGQGTLHGVFSWPTEHIHPFIQNKVTRIIIEDGITGFLPHAFDKVDNLSQVVLPSTLESVVGAIFDMDAPIETIGIPENVRMLGASINQGGHLREINVSQANKTYTSRDGVVYSKDMKTLVVCPNRKSGDFIIPDGVTGLGDSAIRWCPDLDSVTIPKSVTKFGDACFSYSDDFSMGEKFAGILRVYPGSAAETYAKDNAIPYELIVPCMNGHSWDSGVVTREPTTTLNGEKTYTCIVCGAQKTEQIEALPPAMPPTDFTDVPQGKFYTDAVTWAVDKGITSGVSNTSFAPNDTCTRNQIVTFLWRTAGKPEPTTTDNPFLDISPSDYCYKAVLWASENNISKGTDATHFSPEDECTRAQAVTFIWRLENQPESETRSSFSDVSSKSYYSNAVNWAVEYGITSGVGQGRFDPSAACSRAQIVTMLYRNEKN